MRYFVASDIHGDANSVKIIVKKFKDFKCDKILLLGDYLAMDQEENNQIIDILNLFKNDIIAIKGNCDRYYSENAFEFELRDSFAFKVNDRFYLASHGDNLSYYIDNVLCIDNVYLIYGHTHRVSTYISGGINFINIGSISSPRGMSKKCFGILDENGVIIYDLDNQEIASV